MKKRAIIVDRDGTAASVAHVAPTDLSSIAWAMFNASVPFDAPVPAVIDMLHEAKTADPHMVIIMVSGRAGGDWKGDRRRLIIMGDWIAKHDLPIDILIMREGGDQRPDHVVKAEIFDRFIRDEFDVQFAIDDRDSVIEVWKRNGIPVVKVTDPGILPPICGG